VKTGPWGVARKNKRGGGVRRPRGCLFGEKKKQLTGESIKRAERRRKRVSNLGGKTKGEEGRGARRGPLGGERGKQVPKVEKTKR